MASTSGCGAAPVPNDELLDRQFVILTAQALEHRLRLIFSARPTTIQATFEVPFPHPRKLSSRAMQELRVSILRELGVDSYSDDAMEGDHPKGCNLAQ